MHDKFDLNMDSAKESLPKGVAAKLERAIVLIESRLPIMIAFSGGADSTLLLMIASHVSSKDVSACTFKSPVTPNSDIVFAKSIADSLGIKHYLLEHDDLEDYRFRINGPERCLICRNRRAAVLIEFAAKHDIRYVAEGVIENDLNIEKAGVLSSIKHNIAFPLAEARITKKDVRSILKALGYAYYSKPSSSCLAYKIRQDWTIDEESLRKIESIESFLSDLGAQGCRARLLPPTDVQIHASRQGEKILLKPSNRSALIEFCKKAGVVNVTLSLHPYDPDTY